MEEEHCMQRRQCSGQEDGEVNRGRKILQVFVNLGMLLGFLLAVRGSHWRGFELVHMI